MSKYEILEFKDTFNKNKIRFNKIFDLPMRLVIVGKSELSGKGNLLTNLLLRDKFYKSYFKGENIYIISPTSRIDLKMKTIITQLDIPDENVYSSYDEDELNMLYDMIKDEQNERKENNKKMEHYLFIFDDVGFDGSLKGKGKKSFINKLYMNGRHLFISSISIIQKYSDISTGVRENATGLVLFECTNKQLELIYEDHSITDKNTFIRMFRQATREPHSFMVINYSNPKNERFLNNNFTPL
jgi:hypothetical protein